MAQTAMACATARARRVTWATVGAAAAALGLAIGLEAMRLQALIAASCTWRRSATGAKLPVAARYGLRDPGGARPLRCS